jgi:hypothetical protein
MKAITLAPALALVILSCAIAPAQADDSTSLAAPTHQQMMKDCLEKQKTADVTQTKSQMKRMCRDQLKQQKVSGTPLDAPPVDSPKN